MLSWMQKQFIKRQMEVVRTETLKDVDERMVLLTSALNNIDESIRTLAEAYTELIEAIKK